jgi:hypothetical protein
MSRYAATTEVPSERTRADIERLLVRYKATGFGYLWQDQQAVIAFEIAGRRIMMRLPLPDRNDKAITHTPVRHERRSTEGIEQAYEQAVRSRWRALLLIIKAKLEAVEAGISSVEREFLADVALPSGATVGEWLGPQLAQVYGSGDMPALLPGGGR